MLAPADPSPKAKSAAFRRKDQLNRWLESDTNKMPDNRKNSSVKVNFNRGTVFLAACSQCDTAEVESLLRKGVNPNTANVDGLTALHQACIDDNLEMVEFLVSRGAEINVADNEGWTPLHATASCGYIDIASFLINNRADLALVNSDGDLPIDIAEGNDMESLLAEAMASQKIDADDARSAERRQMLEDANDWLRNPSRPEIEHVKTGATALHIAAAKGYHRVITLLLQAGANLNHQDFDGWTPLHGAAHWGQEESCKLLCEANCDMDIKNKAGQTAMDVADEGLIKLLKELHEKQQSIKAQKKDSFDDLIISPGKPAPLKRRSSVTRISTDEKDKILQSSSKEEKGTNLGISEEPDQDETAPPSPKVPTKSPEPTAPADTPKESDDKFDESPVHSPAALAINQTHGVVAPPHTKRASSLPCRLRDADTGSLSRFKEKLNTYRRMTSDDVPSSPTLAADPTSWRAGLRKTGSTGTVPDVVASADKATGVQKSASTSVVINDKASGGVQMRDKTDRRAFATLRDQTAGDRATVPQASQSAYIPYYKRKQMELENKAKEEKEAANSVTAGEERAERPASSIDEKGPVMRQSGRFEAPRRDEEAETYRKLKAKRARETRRSTQGVTQDDVLAAEATLKIADTAKAAVPEIREKEAPEKEAPAPEEKPEEPGRRRVWQREEGTRSSFRKARDVISGTSTSSSTDTSTTPTAYVSRYQRSDRTDPEERQRFSWRDRNGLSDQRESEENKKEEEEGDKNKSGRQLRNRRQRRERRSTGVIHYDENQLEKNEEEKDKDTSEMTTNDTNSAPDTAWSSRYSTRRYGSTSDVPTQMSTNGDRTFRSYRRNQTGIDGDTDYKKMYEEMKAENEKLKKQVGSLETEVTDLRRQSRGSRAGSAGDSLADKREKRALERKISELEEEVKLVESVKQENLKLKEENGALIRVISKLSK